MPNVRTFGLDEIARERFEREVQGGPPLSTEERYELEQVPDLKGEFRVAGFELPGPDVVTGNGIGCAGSAACSLGSTPGEGIAYLFSGSLDLSG